MHEILSTHPAVVAHRVKVDELDTAEAAWRERTRAARADHEAALADFRRKKTDLLLAGRETPAPPEPPADNSDEARLFLDQRSRLRDEERDVYASICHEVEAMAEVRELALIDQARPLVEKLTGVASELEALASAVRTVRLHRERRVDGVPAGEGVSDRIRHRVEVRDLVAAVIDGVSLLAPIDPPQRGIIAAGFQPDPLPTPLTRSRRDQI